MDKETFDGMVSVVYNWYVDEFSNDERDIFRSADVNELHQFHFNLGAEIRNHFNLWDHKWTPQMYDMVDHSPEHPDSISHRVITEVWKLVNNETEAIT